MTRLIVASCLGGVIGAMVVLQFYPRALTREARIAEYYATENAVHVSPHSMRKQLSEGTASSVLVDLRSAEEYAAGHIVTAVNIPAYKDPNTSAYDEKERILGEFENLIAAHPGKTLVVYCYSIPCMTGRKIGALLAEHEIFVQHLGIGWNEWRYAWNMWNHDGETPSRMEDFIATGTEPGLPKPAALPAPCSEGELGC